LTKDTLKAISDLRPNEIAAFAPLILVVLLMGIYPSFFTDPMAASVDQLVARVVGEDGQRLAAQIGAPP
jgi:NADH-quinone oxidoreductase subunit M